MFVLQLSVIDVEGLDIELLMCHIFKVGFRLYFRNSIVHDIADSHLGDLSISFIRYHPRLYFFQL